VPALACGVDGGTDDLCRARCGRWHTNQRDDARREFGVPALACGADGATDVLLASLAHPTRLETALIEKKNRPASATAKVANSPATA
jgi:hypothetical protein